MVSDIQYPVYNSDTGVCHSVVKQLSYRIYHNGTDGITKAHLYVLLTNVTEKHFSQKFSISFHWTKDADNIFHRSGNPGYIIGKPIMAGKKITQVMNGEEEIDKEVIEVSKNPEDWLSIAATAIWDDKCVLDQEHGNSYRQSVTFGEDRLSSCVVSLKPANFTSPSSCTAMQKMLLRILAGSAIENVTAVKNFNLFVATFGDSKAEDTSDWVQVILERVPVYVAGSSLQTDRTLTCKALVTSLQIVVMYAHVGSVAVPQAKILGVVFRFGQPHNLMYSCSTLHCVGDSEDQYAKLVSSVSFIDVTKPSVPQFAEPPVYEIKLPHDFFYPFFSSSLCLYPSSTTLLVLLMVELLI